MKAKICSLPNRQKIYIYAYWKDSCMKYIDCNNAFAKLIGYENPAQIIGKCDQEICNKANKKILLDCTLGDDKVLKNNLTINTVLNLSESGSQLYCKKSPIFNDSGEVMGLAFSAQSIIDQTSEIESSFGLHECLDDIIGCMPNNVYWLNRDCILMGGNDNLVKIFGLKSRSQLVGLNYQQMSELAKWTEGQGEIFKKAELEVMQTGIARMDIEEPPAVIDGQTRYYMSSKVPLKNKNGEVVGVVGISTDITKLKKAQAKSAADEATKRALLIFSGMSTHDLRTPLSSINLRAAFLKKYIPALIEAYKAAADADFDVPHLRDVILEDLQQAPLDILQGLREANNYIDSSLKSLKSASQGEELIDKTQLVDCNIEKLLRRIIASYPYKEGQQDRLHWDHEHDFDFKGHVIFFNRLIENLIKNAFEQIELKGRGEIFIMCRHNGKFNTINIKDTAGGVTQAIIDNMFKGIQSSKEGGTGIGLSSAKQIMQGMNGDIECHLVNGDRIEFVLSFPRYLETNPDQELKLLPTC